MIIKTLSLTAISSVLGHPAQKFKNDGESSGSPVCDIEPKCTFASNGQFKSECGCPSYFQCIWDRPMKRNCPPGLAFDSETGVCQWPFRLCCENEANCCSEGQKWNRNDKKCENELDFECPEAWRNFPHPTDCGKFIKCQSSGAPFMIGSCPEGQFYWHERKMCDKKERVPCENSEN